MKVPHIPLQAAAVQALCSVFIGCPRLMLYAQNDGLIGRLLGEDVPDIVHERFLRALRQMLTAEERRLETVSGLESHNSYFISHISYLIPYTVNLISRTSYLFPHTSYQTNNFINLTIIMVFLYKCHFDTM